MPLIDGYYYFNHEGGKAGTPTVVLLHGAGGDHLCWPAEIRRLPGARVLALDLPGHGKSTGTGRQSVEDYAQSVVNFLDAVNLWHVVLVGHSLGGAIALKVALNHPERILGLGLVSSGRHLPVPAPIIDNVVNPSTFMFAVQDLHALMCARNTSPRLAEQTLKRLMSLRPTLLYGDLLACDRFDASPWLGSIEIPTLVTCGTEDKLTPPRYSSVLAASLRNAALQTVDGGSHLVMLEHPHRLAKMILIFINTIRFVAGG